MVKLGLEAGMTIQELARRGVSGRQIARTLEVTEGNGSVSSAPPRYGRRRWPFAAGLPRQWLARPDCRLAGELQSGRGAGQSGRVARVVGEGGRLSGQPAVAAALRARAIPEAPVAGASRPGREPTMLSPALC